MKVLSQLILIVFMVMIAGHVFSNHKPADAKSRLVQSR